jgi:hypothetical protein
VTDRYRITALQKRLARVEATTSLLATKIQPKTPRASGEDENCRNPGC